MQGLRAIYDHQSRPSDWARLVAEVTPDFCTPEDDPICSDREEAYAMIMEYRVHLAHLHDRDLSLSAALNAKLVAWRRRDSATANLLPRWVPLGSYQRNSIRSLALSIGRQGRILMEMGSAKCVAAYEEAIRYYRRINDRDGEADMLNALGSAYVNVPDIRNPEAAETALRQVLTLGGSKADALRLAESLHTMGMVHHKQLLEAIKRCESPESIERHVQSTERDYKQALAACPSRSLTEVGMIHNQLGALYDDIGRSESAREHYVEAIGYFEQSGRRHYAGKTRLNLALGYTEASEREDAPTRRRDLLARAQAYAEAAQRDLQPYNGRAAAEEGKARQLLTRITRALEALDVGKKGR
jgi:tetratricopeptide (TPR) repeat protein